MFFSYKKPASAPTSQQSDCRDSSSLLHGGYTCQCEGGYQGNPYVHGGCQGTLRSESIFFNYIFSAWICIHPLVLLTHTLFFGYRYRRVQISRPICLLWCLQEYTWKFYLPMQHWLYRQCFHPKCMHRYNKMEILNTFGYNLRLLALELLQGSLYTYWTL